MMRRLPVLLILALAITCFAAACARVVTPTPSPAAEEAAARARADLARRLAASPATIRVEAVEPHTWPDTSLGLPEPGKAYAQVLTSGYVVTLRHEGRAYVYHVAGDTVRMNRPESAPLPGEASLHPAR